MEYNIISGASTRQDWAAWCMTLDEPQAPDGPRAAVEAIADGRGKQHKIVLFLWDRWIVMVGEQRFDCGRAAFEAAQRLCARLWREGQCVYRSQHGGFTYEFGGGR